MHRFLRRAAAVAVALPLVLLLLPTAASAHEIRKVGTIEMTVGWQHEPTYAGVENAVQVFLHDASGKPIDDLGNPTSLKVVAVYDGQPSQALDLQPSWDPDTGTGTHGEWDAALIPTQPGTYTFAFTGSVDGQPVDQRFTSSDSTFASVQNPNDIEFPTKTPTNADLATGFQVLQPRVATAKSQASSAHDSASTALVLSVVALVVAVVGAGGAIVIARRRS
jgi:hypothetical protein